MNAPLYPKIKVGIFSCCSYCCRSSGEKLKSKVKQIRIPLPRSCRYFSWVSLSYVALILQGESRWRSFLGLKELNRHWIMLWQFHYPSFLTFSKGLLIWRGLDLFGRLARLMPVSSVFQNVHMTNSSPVSGWFLHIKILMQKLSRLPSWAV